MVANRVKKIWAEGGTVCNGWLAIPNAVPAEFMAHQGWDSITIDMQHGLVELSDALSMLQALSTTDVMPIVRVNWNDPAPIMKALDMGAMGIICPMINSREECERFVGACRYAPDGYRSVGPVRAALAHGGDYIPTANKSILTMAMIETKQAVERLDEILTTPGLDSIYVGPSDLSVSYGHSAGFDPKTPEVLDAIHKIAKAAKKHGIAAGIHTGSVAYGLEMVEAGYQFITFLSELRLMSWAAKNMTTAFKAGKPAPNAP
ncbi:MAG: aldolase/citrate lyase family protein [Proteobacteria bacterium]|nr:aldolase/citrate lyase family protein [Pseudomonadota bacterium]